MCDHRLMAEQQILWTTVPGPWGPFHIAASDRGIVAIDCLTSTDDVESRLARRTGGWAVHVSGSVPATRAGRYLTQAVEALDALLAGRAAPSSLAFDLVGRSAWDQRVLGAVAGIPRGRTRSYGEIARQIGSPGAARAVGGAVGRNPIGLLIPCHRVIAGDGSIGGYGGDAWGSREERSAIKRALLHLEGVELPP